MGGMMTAEREESDLRDTTDPAIQELPSDKGQSRALTSMESMIIHLPNELIIKTEPSPDPLPAPEPEPEPGKPLETVAINDSEPLDTNKDTTSDVGGDVTEEARAYRNKFARRRCHALVVMLAVLTVLGVLALTAAMLYVDGYIIWFTPPPAEKGMADIWLRFQLKKNALT